MTTSTTRSQERHDAGAFLATVLTRATCGLQEIRARREAARAAHSLRALSDRQRRDLGLAGTRLELLVRGLTASSMADGHVDR